MSALVVDRIGLLVTNDPSLGEGPLGIVRDVMVGGEWIVRDGRHSAFDVAAALQEVV